MTTRIPTTKAGDRIEIEAHRVGEAHRTGEILEVLGDPGHEHYRVSWEDGTVTTFYPSSDAQVVQAQGT